MTCTPQVNESMLDIPGRNGAAGFQMWLQIIHKTYKSLVKLSNKLTFKTTFVHIFLLSDLPWSPLAEPLSGVHSVH